MFFRIGWIECFIILVVLLVVVGMAYRGGYFRARRK
jgi:Sec-independent protein translocase protein TatA